MRSHFICIDVVFFRLFPCRMRILGQASDSFTGNIRAARTSWCCTYLGILSYLLTTPASSQMLSEEITSVSDLFKRSRHEESVTQFMPFYFSCGVDSVKNLLQILSFDIEVIQVQAGSDLVENLRRNCQMNVIIWGKQLLKQQIKQRIMEFYQQGYIRGDGRAEDKGESE